MLAVPLTTQEPSLEDLFQHVSLLYFCALVDFRDRQHECRRLLAAYRQHHPELAS